MLYLLALSPSTDPASCISVSSLVISGAFLGAKIADFAKRNEHLQEEQMHQVGPTKSANLQVTGDSCFRRFLP